MQSDIKNQARYTVSIVMGDVSVIGSMAGEWNALCDEGPCNVVFYRPEVVSSYIRSFQTAQKVLLVVVRNGENHLRALLPLVYKRYGKGPLHRVVLRNAGNLDSSGMDIIHGTGDRELVAEAVAAFMSSWNGWDVAHFAFYREDGALAEVIERVRASGASVGKIWDLYDWHMPTQIPNSTVVQALPMIRKSLGKQLRRDLRRAQEQGEVTWSVTGPESGPQAVRDALQEFFELEQRGWKGRAGIAGLQHKDLLAYCDEMVSLGNIIVHKYLLDGKPIAIRYGVVSGDQYNAKRTTYDERFSRLSPGQLLCLYASCELANRGCTTYRFGVSDDNPNNFKRMWTDQRDPILSRLVFRKTLTNRVAHVMAFEWLPVLAKKFPGVRPLTPFRNLNTQSMTIPIQPQEVIAG